MVNNYNFYMEKDAKLWSLHFQKPFYVNKGMSLLVY